MGERKGQVTIFIMIGAIILFSAITIFYLQSKQVEVAEVPIITEEIPTEMQPVKSYVDNCLHTIALEAVERIGVHGGYIGLENNDRIYTGVTFKTEPQVNRPTEFDALTFAPDLKIPYWWYLESPNKCSDDCSFNSRRPYLWRNEGPNSIEEQIDRYVSINLPRCLKNFESFKAKGMDITNTSGVKTITTIARDDVAVFVEYPLEIKWAGGEATVSQFGTRIDVRLREMYELASKITLLETQKNFLERHTLNIISAYGGLDENKLPPMAGTELSFMPLRWSNDDVEENLKEKLIVYVNMLQATNTYNADIGAINFPDNPIRTGLYNQMVIPLDGSYYGYEVKFNYLGWPMYLYLTGGGSVGPRDSITIPIVSSILPIQRYDVPYDVSYPVMVSIYDADALKGKGYRFLFALESNVRNNEPLAVDEVQLSQSRDEDVTSLCEDYMRTSGNVTLIVADRLMNPVPGATVILSMGDRGCVMGETELDETGTRAIFKGPFPRGAMGSIVIMHPEYETAVIKPFKAKKEPIDLGVIKLNGYVYKNISVVKMNINKEYDWESASDFYVPKKWMFVPLKRPLAGFENATILLQRIQQNPIDAIVSAGAMLSAGEKKEIRLLPGEYTMNVILVQDPVTIIIPKDEVCWEEHGEEKCEDIPKVELVNNEPFMAGQYEMNVTFGNEIYDNNTIEFTAINYNLKDATPKKHKDLSIWGTMPQEIASDPDWNFYLQPRFIPIS